MEPELKETVGLATTSAMEADKSDTEAIAPFVIREGDECPQRTADGDDSHHVVETVRLSP